VVIDIATVARRSGVPASTLRFYEQKGLIASVGRRGNRRLFDEEVVDHLAFIALVGSAGFSLDEIAGMLTKHGAPQIDRAALAARASEIDDTISHLAAISSWLRRAAACPAPNHMECPSFRDYINLASTGAIGRRLPGKLRPHRKHPAATVE
jgi:DNA-binding transcriptional MerR regulator